MMTWKKYTVEQLIDLDMLEAPMDGNHGSIHPKASDYVLTGVPFIMVNDISNGHVDLKNCAFISEKQAATLRKGFAKPGDVLLSHKATIGRTAIVPNDFNTIILTPQITYYRVKKGIDNRFLKYYFDSPNFQSLFNNWAGSGSTRAYLGITAQRKLPIILPELDEQIKIADILSSLDEKIHKNNEINNNLEQQAKVLYKDWFFNFSPFSTDGTLPDGWRVGNVNDIIQLHDSKRVPLSGAERDKMAKIYPYYGATSLMDYVDNYLFDGIYLLLGEDGTVVDSLGFPILQYVYGQFWVNNHAHIITGKEGFSVEELYLFFSLTNIKSIVTGAVQQKVSQQNLRKVPAVIPNKEVLSAFDKLIQPMFAQIRNIRDENASLVKIRDTLLVKLMSGDIDVSDIDL